MASNLYNKLEQTAKAHLQACLPKTKGSNDVDTEAILSHLSSDFRQDWGHSFFVSTKPALQGEVTGQGFITHMAGMAPALQTWDIIITSICVDVEKKCATVRVVFHMKPKGGEEVLNDIVFWMFMNESGEKLVRCTEFIDPVASAELGRRMKAGMET